MREREWSRGFRRAVRARETQEPERDGFSVCISTRHEPPAITGRVALVVMDNRARQFAARVEISKDTELTTEQLHRIGAAIVAELKQWTDTPPRS